MDILTYIYTYYKYDFVVHTYTQDPGPGRHDHECMTSDRMRDVLYVPVLVIIPHQICIGVP
jgi:hypothetical protein